MRYHKHACICRSRYTGIASMVLNHVHRKMLRVQFSSAVHFEHNMWYNLYMQRLCSNPVCARDISAKESRAKYCSRSCAARVNNSKYPKRAVKDLKSCPCGTELKPYQKGYCSRQHSAIYRGKAYIERWLAGEESGSKANGSLSTIVRNYLLLESGYSCSECGWDKPNPVLGRPILTIDHRDGNWKNNSRDNLIVLCYNCHTLTPTFGALNVGSESGRRPWAANRKEGEGSNPSRTA